MLTKLFLLSCFIFVAHTLDIKLPEVLLDHQSPLEDSAAMQLKQEIERTGSLPAQLRKAAGFVSYDSSRGDSQFPAILYGKEATQFPAILYDASGNQFPAILYGKDASGNQFPAILYAQDASNKQFPAILYTRDASGNQFPAILYSKDASGTQFPAILYAKDASGKQFPAILYSNDAQFPAILYGEHAQFPAILYGQDASGNQFPAILYGRDESGNQFPAILYGIDESGNEQFPAILYGKDASGSQQFPAILYAKDASGNQFPAILYGKETSGSQFPAILYGKDASGNDQFPAILYGKDASGNKQFPAILYSKDASGNQFPAILYGNDASDASSNEQFPAILYGKDASGNKQFPAILYGKDTAPRQFSAILYGKDASTSNQFPAILYGRDGSGSRRALSAAAPSRYEHNLFFKPEALQSSGMRIEMPTMEQKFPSTKFLHPLLESTFGSRMRVDKLLSMLAIPEASPLAATIKEGHFACAQKALPRETRGCHATASSMVGLVKSVLKPRIKSCKSESSTGNRDCSIKHLTTLLPEESPLRDSFRSVKIVESEAVANGSSVVVCHPVLYAYSVYMCHAIPNNAAFKVTVEDTQDGSKLVIPAVCHFDTSMFNPGFISFKVLGNKPGDPVCHWVATNTIFWYV